MVMSLVKRGWPSGRASAFQADLHGFDSRTPLQILSPDGALAVSLPTMTPVRSSILYVGY
jgi:hypothetical protein